MKAEELFFQFFRPKVDRIAGKAPAQARIGLAFGLNEERPPQRTVGLS